MRALKPGQVDCVLTYTWKLWTSRNERMWNDEDKGPLLLKAGADEHKWTSGLCAYLYMEVLD